MGKVSLLIKRCITRFIPRKFQSYTKTSTQLRASLRSEHVNEPEQGHIDIDMSSIDACQAYLNLLRNLGADQSVLNDRLTLLTSLHQLLHLKPKTQHHYTSAFQRLLQQIERGHWAYSLIVFSEYRLFWLEDVRGIIHATEQDNFCRYIVNTRQKVFTVDELQQSVTNTIFSTGEKWALHNYQSALRLLPRKNSGIEQKIMVCKWIVWMVRTFKSESNRPYTRAVYALLPTFINSDERSSFVRVCREFYPFWDGNPKATYILFSQNDVPTEDLEEVLLHGQ